MKLREIKFYKGLPVIHRKKAKTGKPRVRASYSRSKQEIYTYPYLWEFDRPIILSIFEHEVAHHTYYKMSDRYIKAWELIDSMHPSILSFLTRFGSRYVFDTNEFPNNYAKTSVKESFAETIEMMYLIESGYIKDTVWNYFDIKMIFCEKALQKFGDYDGPELQY